MLNLQYLIMPVSVEELNGVDPIHKALDSQGITPMYLAKRLKRELNAKEVKVFKSMVYGGDGECGDEIIYSKPLVAWAIRQKARQDAHKLRGDYPAEKLDITDIRMVQIILDALPPDVRDAVKEAIKKKAKK